MGTPTWSSQWRGILEEKGKVARKGVQTLCSVLCRVSVLSVKVNLTIMTSCLNLLQMKQSGKPLFML